MKAIYTLGQMTPTRPRKTLAIGLACVAAVIRSPGASAGDGYPPVLVKDAEIRVLPRTREDRQYELYIGLPASFRSSPGRKYPVVFVTDGYYDFSGVASTYSNMVWDKSVPEMIVVGLGYAGDNPDYEALRVDDLCPMQMDGKGGRGGQAGKFLNMIESQAIPLLEREYRADPANRILMGCSNGGCFTLYALYTKPGLFQGYVAASPNVSQLWQLEEDFAKSGRTVGARVFMTTGEFEFPSYHREILSFNERLQRRTYLKGGYQFRMIESMRHAGEKAESYTQGLRYVAGPMAEAGPSAELFSDPSRGTYEIIFQPRPAFRDKSAWTPTQAELVRDHVRLIDKESRDQGNGSAIHSPDGETNAFSSFYLFAKDGKEAEAFGASDPAVAAGILDFEVICVRDPPGAVGK
jgi:predicted alpha/beta superfamily hydrolase